MQEIQSLLFENRDTEYADFMGKLLPNISPERLIGVRTPVLRKLAKGLAVDSLCEDFLKTLPHEYFEENQLHGFVVSGIKDFDECVAQLEKFLLYIDNWATCDQTSPKIFKKHKEELLPYIEKWLDSRHTYTVRFAIGMLMQHYLDSDFKPEYIKRVAEIRSEEYYVNMEIAWYMATALAKQWDCAVTYIENKSMDKWVHNKTIQKACESLRIGSDKKIYLRTLKI
jgi:3-methyladenine DNA glycosylase AlkD